MKQENKKAKKLQIFCSDKRQSFVEIKHNNKPGPKQKAYGVFLGLY